MSLYSFQLVWGEVCHEMCKMFKKNGLLWRFITGVPIIVGVFMFLLFLTCYRFDTPSKYIENGKDDLALKHLEKFIMKN